MAGIKDYNMDPHFKVASLQDPLDIRQVTYTNLLLLGFNATAAEHKWRIPFDKDMFTLPNKKGFEVVMQFLLHRFNPVRFKEEFRDCWPVGDKKQEHQFRKACCDWLSQLAKEEDVKLPRINAALFMSPGGDKFYQLLHALSTHVIKHIIHQEHCMKQAEYLRRPILTSQNTSMEDAMDHLLQCATSRERQRFLNYVQQGCCVQDYWRNYSTDLVRDYRSLNRKVKELEREVKTEIQALAQKGSAYGIPASKRGMMSEYEMQVGSVKRAEHIRRCREMWKTLDKFYENVCQEQEILEDILENNSNRYKVDAAELNVRIPDLLLRECEQEIHQRNVNNIFEGGRLNLLSVVHLWNLSLHLYIEKLHQTGMPNFDKVMPQVSAQVHSHQAHLANAVALKKQLSAMLPDLKSSISGLRKEMDSVLFHSKSPNSIRITSVGLGLLPPTPPINFDFEGVSYKQDEVTKSLAKTPGMETNVSTPEGANALMDKIQRKVRADGASPLVQGSPVYGGRMTTSNAANKNHSHTSKLPKYETKPDHAHHRKQKFEHGMGASHKNVLNENSSNAKPAARWTSLSPVSSGSAVPKNKRRLSERSDSYSAVRSSRNTKSFKEPQSIARSKMKHKLGKNEVPAAHDILAERIAEELLAATPRRQSLSRSKEEPFNLELALGNTAFESKDKLGRTPPSQQPSNWHETLMQRMDGPLSSTRVEHSSPASTRPFKDNVVTKLFADEDGYSDTVDVGLSEVASTISATESRIPEMIEDEEDERVMDIVNSLRGEARGWMDNGYLLTEEEDEKLISSIRGTIRSPLAKSPKQGKAIVDVEDDLLNEALPLEDELLPLASLEALTLDSEISVTPQPINLISNTDNVFLKEPTYSPVLPERLRSLLASSGFGQVPDNDKTPELQEIRKLRRSMQNYEPESNLLSMDKIEDFLGTESAATDAYTSQTEGAKSSESEGEEIDSQARIIEVQNGSYRETLEPSPNKTRSSVSDELLIAATKTPAIKPSLSRSSTADLLTRYRLLSVQSSAKSSEPLRPTEPMQSAEMSPKPSENKAPLSDVYLQRTPNKLVNKNKRSLSFVSDEDESKVSTGRELPVLDQHFRTEEQRLTQSLPLKELSVNTSSFGASPLSTPKGKGETPGYTFSSIPLSPLTDVLHHNEGLTEMGSSKPSHSGHGRSVRLWSILDEDDSVLLPPSPPNINANSNSPMTAKLIDF